VSRPTVTYPAQDASVKGTFTRSVLAKRPGVCFGEGVDNSIEWDISVGLAQVYALRFWYMNTTHQPIAVTIQIIDDKGEILKNDRITFLETPEKWRIVNTTTERCINAGTYKVRLQAAKMNGLCFYALDIQ